MRNNTSLCSAELVADVAALDSNKGFGAICGTFSASRVATSENSKFGVVDCFSGRVEGVPKASGRLENALTLVELVNTIFPSVALPSENGNGAGFCSSAFRKGKSP